MKSPFLALAGACALVVSASPAFAADAPVPAAPAPAPAAVVVEGCGCQPTCCDRGVAVWAEALLIRFYPSVSDWATEGDATASFPTGRIHEVEYDHELGLRAGMVWRRPGSKVGLGVQVTWANPDLSASATAPAGGSLALTHNTANGSDFVVGASANHAEEIDYLVIDAGVCFHRECGDGASAMAWAGARFAQIDRSASDTITAPGLTETVDSSADLTGVGMVIGGELRWGFCGGWSVWGRASGGILLSSIEANLRDVANAVTLADASNDIERITPFAELGLGVGWGCPRLFGSCIGLNVDLGFELGNWFNVLDPLSYVDDIKDSALDQESDDLGWSALSLKVTFSF